jgi:tRNA threonylcarbamoyladenosine biosynthesis protein TsaE
MNDSTGVVSCSLRWFSKTTEDTEAFGARLAVARPLGDAFGTIYLSGDLGAGKTTLARGFVRAMGVTGTVRSPTYTLVEVHETPSISVVHFDLYRLMDPEELESLGLREWARPGHVWLVEWPERAAERLPVPDLSVVITAGVHGHEINVTAMTALGQSWVSAVENTAGAP